jgi:hypothetical protein
VRRRSAACRSACGRARSGRALRDGRSPYTQAQWRPAGFDVVAFDVDDVPAVNRMAHLLGWTDDPEDPWDDHDVSVLYTLVRRDRPARPA